MIKAAINKVMMSNKLLSLPLLNRAKQKVARPANRYFFVHVPKTAGTSFRKALEANHNVICDYGVNSPETSSVMRDYVHEQEDFFQLKQTLNQAGDFWLCGHVVLHKYVDFVPVRKTITFVREPVSQVVSHYNHYVSYYNYTGNLETFASQSGMRNLQYRLLNCLPVSLIGYVGLTEKYNESLGIINKHLDLNIKSIKTNVNETKTLTLSTLTDEQKQIIIKSNDLDISLYEEACFLHQERVKILAKNQSWVYAYINLNAKKVLNGCAFYSDNDKAVNLVIVKNGEKLLKASAKGFYNGQPKVNFPRGRYIGFNITLAKEINKDDIIDVYVEETGQKLNFKPLKVG